MPGLIPGMTGSGNAPLQATIAAASASHEEPILPHHPITCPDNIYYDEDGTFRCEHATAPPDNARTQHCVTHSIALLLINLAMEL